MFPSFSVKYRYCVPVRGSTDMYYCVDIVKYIYIVLV